MLQGVKAGAEDFPDVVDALRLMPICITMNKLPYELDGEDEWMLDFITEFIHLRDAKTDMEIKKREAESKR